MVEITNQFINDQFELRGLKEHFEREKGWKPAVEFQTTQVYQGIGKTATATCEFDDIINMIKVHLIPSEKDLEDPVF